MSAEQVVAVVLADIAVIAVLARLVGALFTRLHQPPVIGEILAGIALGPTILGLTIPDAPTFLFPAAAQPHLNVIAQLGLVIFMFLIGLELNTKLIRGHRRGVALVVSASSVMLPLGLGALLAIWLYRHHAPAGTSVLPFALFVGAAMAVTAFPVLVRILTERGMYHTPTGALATACAAADDVLAWTLLAVAVAIANSAGVGNVLLTAAGAALYVAVMMTVVRPRLAALTRRHERAAELQPALLIAITSGALLSATITSAIGIHAIFGAFLFGAIWPREGAAALIRDIKHGLEPFSTYVLLPVFFVVTGLRVDVTQLDRLGWVELAAVLGVACISKFVGAAGAARAFGITWRRSAALGVLMNTRGLTELVILSVGRELHLIDDQLFTIMVLMAIVTTIVASPLLRLIYPAEILALERASSRDDPPGSCDVPPPGTDPHHDTNTNYPHSGPDPEGIVVERNPT